MAPPTHRMKLLTTNAISIGAGAVYPYSDELLQNCSRESSFGDFYSLCRVVGTGSHKRIWIPRNMAPGAISDLRSEGVNYNFKSTFVPRSMEQSRIIGETTNLLLDGESFIVEAFTGSGKTWMATDIIANIGKKTLVVVTKEDIRDQWIAAITACLGLVVGDGIGIIQGGVCTTQGHGIVIAMIQSVAKENRYPESVFKEFGLVIWDECHRVAADHFSQSCFRVPAKLRLGLSATPDRKDGKLEVLYAHIGPTLVTSKSAQLLPRVIIQRSPWEVPYVNKKQKTGGYKLVQVAHSAGKCMHVIKMLSNNFARNLILSRFVSSAYKKGRVVLIQSELKDHLDILASMISNQGVPMGDIAYYVGGMSSSERDYSKTKKVIMATYAMTAEATDIPQLDTLVMATPRSDVRQIVGRILREFPGKKDPVVFDIVDSTSSVFAGYYNMRYKWYKEVGAVIDKMQE